MCGIAGWFYANDSGRPLDDVRIMAAALRHRGPDDEGFAAYLYGSGAVRGYRGERTTAALSPSLPALTPDADLRCRMALGHARLSIIDLSEMGHQPMRNEDGSVWAVYNGEIYNYRELMSELVRAGHVFHSHTDTEVILHAYEEWGTGCLTRFNGMFAFALWDNTRERLFCARDRFGIKPFYYARSGSGIMFASEIKALLAVDGRLRVPDDASVMTYLAYSRKDHSGRTFFAGVRQLPPATYMVATASGLETDRYWDLPRGGSKSMPLAEGAALFRSGFSGAVERHMRSDVPVGFCVSGGLDSSSIVAAVDELRRGDGIRYDKEFNTFTACYEQRGYDERPYLEAAIDGRPFRSHLVFPRPDDFTAGLDRFLWHQEEPFGRFSAFSQYCVMERAGRESMKVLLDGQGGDELLAGYHAYWIPYLQDLLLGGRLEPFRNELNRIAALIGEKRSVLIRSVAGGLAPGALQRLWRKRRNPYVDFPWLRQVCALERPSFVRFRSGDRVSEWSYNDLLIRQLQKLLHFEDRNSMAFGIESRVPFLDTELVETVFAMPGELKIGSGWPKRVLREGMRGLLPPKILERRDKMGFVTPGEDLWIRHDLRSWFDGLMASETFRSRPYWDHGRVANMYARYQGGDARWRLPLMNLFTVELWLRRFIDRNDTGAAA